MTGAQGCIRFRTLAKTTPYLLVVPHGQQACRRRAGQASSAHRRRGGQHFMSTLHSCTDIRVLNVPGWNGSSHVFERTGHPTFSINDQTSRNQPGRQFLSKLTKPVSRRISSLSLGVCYSSMRLEWASFSVPAPKVPVGGSGGSTLKGGTNTHTDVSYASGARKRGMFCIFSSRTFT